MAALSSGTTSRATALHHYRGLNLDLGRETLRNWVRQAEIDSGDRDGVTTAEAEEIKRLKAENKRLREANEILRKASIFFASMSS
ncbi:transposase [Kocuria flava]|uniref:Transposase n=1 Tax=Kocuria flava TaxID=446860 RepID=A0A0U3GAD3_9MICC|nr:transposase [Kocuria flava]